MQKMVMLANEKLAKIKKGIDKLEQIEARNNESAQN
jgi:hypothetical protein